jgi:hypothetical protein
MRSCGSIESSAISGSGSINSEIGLFAKSDIPYREPRNRKNRSFMINPIGRCCSSHTTTHSNCLFRRNNVTRSSLCCVGERTGQLFIQSLTTTGWKISVIVCSISRDKLVLDGFVSEKNFLNLNLSNSCHPFVRRL